jgi:small subunit ribosomal protein S4
VNIPSYPIKIGDVVEITEKSREMVAIQGAIEAVARRGIPQWMELDKEKKRGVIKSLPVREDLTMPIQEQLIVELYSK